MLKRITIVLMMAVALSGCEPLSPTGPGGQNTKTGGASGRAKGAKEATDAIAAGTLKLREYPPLPSPAWLMDYIKALKEKCGVGYEVASLPEGVADADFRQEIQEWNEVMTAEISKRFGANTVQKLREEARTNWESRKSKK